MGTSCFRADSAAFRKLHSATRSSPPTTSSGRYERSAITPSIEGVAKLADVFGVSIAYLAGRTALKLDAPLTRKIEDIERLPDSDRAFVMRVLDMALRDARASV